MVKTDSKTKHEQFIKKILGYVPRPKKILDASQIEQTIRTAEQAKPKPFNRANPSVYRYAKKDSWKRRPTKKQLEYLKLMIKTKKPIKIVKSPNKPFAERAFIGTNEVLKTSVYSMAKKGFIKKTNLTTYVITAEGKKWAKK